MKVERIGKQVEIQSLLILHKYNLAKLEDRVRLSEPSFLKLDFHSVDCTTMAAEDKRSADTISSAKLQRPDFHSLFRPQIRPT